MENPEGENRSGDEENHQIFVRSTEHGQQRQALRGN